MLIFLLWPALQWAGEGHRLRHFSPQEFQAQNQNWAFTQSPNGLIYVANSGGVLSFDGVRWQKFQLPGRPIVRTVRYHQGRLYAGGYGEFGYFSDLDSSSPTYTSLSKTLTDRKELNEEIWHISVLEDGKIIFQSFAELFLFDNEQLSAHFPPGLMMFGKEDGDNLLLPVSDSGLISWQNLDNFQLLPGTEALQGQRIIGVARDADRLLLAVQSGTIYQWKTGQLSAIPTPEALKTAQINRLLLLRDGTLAVGTILQGLYLLAPDGSLINHLDQTNGLRNNTILSLFEDQAGDLWLGLDHGIDLLVRSEAMWFHSSEQQALGSVYDAEMVDELFYLGTNQGLFVRPADQPESPFEFIQGTAGQVWDLCATPAGLLCGHNEGTFLVEGNKAQLISNYSGGWQTLSVPNSDGLQFMQATYTGLVLLSYSDDQWHAYYLKEFVAPLRYIAWTAPQELLALHGSLGGYRIRLSPDYQSYIQIDTLNQVDLSQARLSEPEGQLVVQTREHAYTAGPNTLEPLPDWKGHRIQSENYLLPGRGTDWFSVQADRVAFYQDTQLIHTFPIRLPAPHPRIIPWSDRQYLLCLDDGYALMQPDNEVDFWPPLQLFGDFRNRDKWERINFQEAVQPEIPYSKNHLRFQFAQSLFDRKLQFRYRLIGFSPNWSAWSAQGGREFTNLRAGPYRLEVMDNWSHQVVSRSFRILPPWYLSTWAYLCYILALPLVAYSLLHWHRRRLSTQARSLELKRQRELQRQRILSRNLQLEQDNQRKNKELANSTLAIARKNELLLGFKEELKKARKRGQGSIAQQDIQRLQHLIDQQLRAEEDWAIFEAHFDEVHEAFLKRLRIVHPELTAGDLKLSAYLRMNLSSKEIAPLLHISLRGVENKRYRLRTKLGLDPKKSLNKYLLDF